MEIKTINNNLRIKHEEKNEIIKKATRNGIEIEKGVILTEEYINKHLKEIEDLMNIYITYPDLYLDEIKPSDSNFKLFFYQRIVLRAIMRFKEVYIIACRAFSKSFITILAIFLQCVFIPGTKRFICAPNKNQAAQIAKEKIFDSIRQAKFDSMRNLRTVYNEMKKRVGRIPLLQDFIKFNSIFNFFKKFIK